MRWLEITNIVEICLDNQSRIQLNWLLSFFFCLLQITTELLTLILLLIFYSYAKLNFEIRQTYSFYFVLYYIFFSDKMLDYTVSSKLCIN